jgi:hypothetical protein
MIDDTSRDRDEVVREEEEAAAGEAARIGGPAPDYEVDERTRPLQESGEGEAEGFEDAERELIEEATHGDAAWDPETDRFSPEEESDRATAVDAEPDEIDPTEVTRDPREGDDDPGAGPGVAADR